MDLFTIDAASLSKRHDTVLSTRPRPWNVSPWVAMSALQKGIRRNDAAVALAAASTLLDAEPSRLWRRLVAICFEDIGIGEVETVTGIIDQIGAHHRRSLYGDDWTAALTFVIAMCSATKDRSADDLLIAAANHPALLEARRTISSEAMAQQLSRVREPGSLLNKAIAVYGLAAPHRSEYRPEKRPGAALWQALSDAGCEKHMLALCHRGYQKTRESLPALLALLSSAGNMTSSVERIAEDDPGTDAVAACLWGVPLYAFDQFSREGKGIIHQFLQGQTETARWVKEAVPNSQRSKFLGGLLFRVESGLVKRRRSSTVGDKLRYLADTGFHGLVLTDPAEPLKLMRADLHRLDELRYRALRDL